MVCYDARRCATYKALGSVCIHERLDQSSSYVLAAPVGAFERLDTAAVLFTCCVMSMNTAKWPVSRLLLCILSRLA